VVHTVVDEMLEDEGAKLVYNVTKAVLASFRSRDSRLLAGSSHPRFSVGGRRGSHDRGARSRQARGALLEK
jgi:hypothetical protein